MRLALRPDDSEAQEDQGGTAAPNAHCHTPSRVDGYERWWRGSLRTTRYRQTSAPSARSATTSRPSGCVRFGGAVRRPSWRV